MDYSSRISSMLQRRSSRAGLFLSVSFFLPHHFFVVPPLVLLLFHFGKLLPILFASPRLAVKTADTLHIRWCENHFPMNKEVVQLPNLNVVVYSVVLVPTVDHSTRSRFAMNTETTPIVPNRFLQAKKITV